MSDFDPAIDQLFSALRHLEPTGPQVHQVLQASGPVAPRPERRKVRLTRTTAILVSLITVLTVGAIGAVATRWQRVGHNDSPVALVTSADPTPNALLRTVGALRAPATDPDRDAEAIAAGASVRNSGPVYSNGVRLIGTSPLGEKMYLVPVEDTSAANDPHGSAGSVSQSAVALVVQGPYGGVGTTAPIPMGSIVSPRLGIEATEAPAVGPGAEALRASTSVPDALKGGSWWVDIVPDGVATVRATLQDGTVTDLHVHSNVVLAHSNQAVGTNPPEHVTWLAGDGSTIKAP